MMRPVKARPPAFTGRGIPAIIAVADVWHSVSYIGLSALSRGGLRKPIIPYI